MNSETTKLMKDALIQQLEDQSKAIRQVADSMSEDQLWAKPMQPGNSVGHLVLHLTGNLNHYVGAQLGGTGYRRDREREFSETDPPDRATLLANLDHAVSLSRRIVSQLSDEQLQSPHPETRFGTIGAALVHLVAHFALHRGQITYIARAA